MELAKRLKVKKKAQMENETDPERKTDLSEDEMGGGGVKNQWILLNLK